MDSLRISKFSALLAISILVAACGGGGGSSGSGSGDGGGDGGGGGGDPTDGSTGGTGDQLEIFEASSSGLMAVHPTTPDSPMVLDANADFTNVNSIPVLGAAWNNGQTDNGHIQTLVYQNSDNHIMKISTDASGGVTPTPQRVSDNLSEICRFNIGQDFADVSNVRVALQHCADDDWWWTILSRDENGKIVDFPGEPLVDLIATSDGSHDGWLALDQGKIRRMDDQGVTADVIGTPSGISEATHLESIQSGKVMLNIDGNLYVYSPGSGLNDLGHSFTYDTCITGPATCPVLHVVDDSELFFIDNDRLYRTDLTNDRVIELDAAVAPSAFAVGGRRLTVGTNRVVWSYETDPDGTAFSGDEETIIRTVNKDTGSAGTLDTVPQLDVAASAPNQPFLDRTGDWFFYTWSNGVGTQPTAVAARMDQSDSESYAGAAWVGVSTNLISFANLNQSLQAVYLADGLSDSTQRANKNLKSVTPASPGTPTSLGTIPSDSQGFLMMGGFGLNRLAFLTADDGGTGQQQDVMFLAGDTAGSLQRVTNTTSEDENPGPFF